MPNRFTTKCGDIVAVEIYHQYICKNPDGSWLGYDSEPKLTSWGWERQWDSPDHLNLIQSGNPIGWKESLEKVDYYQEQKAQQEAKPKYCQVCGKPGAVKFQDTKALVHNNSDCYVKMGKLWQHKVWELSQDFDRFASNKRYW